MSAVWKTSKASGSDLLMLLALADYANERGYCWPSIDTLAQKMRSNRATVMRVAKRLEKLGELYVLHRRNAGNKYIVLLGVAEELAQQAMIADCGLSQAEAELAIKACKSLREDKSQVATYSISSKMIQNKSQLATKNVAPVQHDPSSTVINPSKESSEPPASELNEMPEASETFAPTAQTPGEETKDKYQEHDKPKPSLVEMVDAFQRALADSGRNPTYQNWYARFGKQARAMIKAGRTAQQVYRATCAIYSPQFHDDFYRKRALPVTLEEVGQVWDAAEKAAAKLEQSTVYTPVPTLPADEMEAILHRQLFGGEVAS